MAEASYTVKAAGAEDLEDVDEEQTLSDATEAAWAAEKAAYQVGNDNVTVEIDHGSWEDSGHGGSPPAEGEATAASTKTTKAASKSS